MNQPQVILNTLFALVCALFIGTKSFAEPANLGQLKDEIATYHASGQYDKEFSSVIKEAEHFLDDTANHNAASKTPRKLALVLDIDETSLSNYPLMQANRYCAKISQFEQAQLDANEPALKATQHLYQNALQHHIAVFFITGRPEALKNATEKNLKAEGFTQWTGIYYKPTRYKRSSVIPFKSRVRAIIEQKGYKIVASIGDQHSDLLGGHAMRTFKLPNPHYYIP